MRIRREEISTNNKNETEEISTASKASEPPSDLTVQALDTSASRAKPAYCRNRSKITYNQGLIKYAQVALGFTQQLCYDFEEMDSTNDIRAKLVEDIYNAHRAKTDYVLKRVGYSSQQTVAKSVTISIVAANMNWSDVMS